MTTSPRSRSRSDWGWRPDARRQPASARRSARQSLATVGPRGLGAPRPLAAPGIAAGVLALVVRRSLHPSARRRRRPARRRCTTSRPGSSPRRRGRPRCRRPGRPAQARLTAFQTVVAQRLAWEDVLRDLSRVLPAQRLAAEPQRDLADAHRRRGGRCGCRGADAGGRSGDAGRLHRHRQRRLAGAGRAGARPAGAPPLAVERDAPVERARRRRARPCSSRSERLSAPLEVDDDRAPQRTRGHRGRRGRAPARRCSSAGSASSRRSGRRRRSCRRRSTTRRLQLADRAGARPTARPCGRARRELATLRTAIPDEVQMSGDPAPALEGVGAVARAHHRDHAGGGRRVRCVRRRADQRHGRGPLLRDLRDFLRLLRAERRPPGRQASRPPDGSSASTRSSSRAAARHGQQPDPGDPRGHGVRLPRSAAAPARRRQGALPASHAEPACGGGRR